MAVAIESDSGVIEHLDNDIFTPAETGSNRLVIACVLMTDNTSTLGTLDTHTLEATNFDSDVYFAVSGPSSPFGRGAVSYFLDGNVPSANCDYDLIISETFSNSGTYLCELANVDQTTPVSFNEVIKLVTQTTSPTHTVSAPAGALVILLVSCSTAQTITTPIDNSGDSWVAQVANDTGMVGGGLSNGSIFTCLVSGAWTDESVTAAYSASTTHALSLCVVVDPSTGTVSNPKGPLGMPLHGAFGGPI